MSSDPWGTGNDPFNEGQTFDASVVEPEPSKGKGKRHLVLLGAASAVTALVALAASLAGVNGYGAVGLSAVGYLLAVLADLSARRSRYRNKNYRRPLTTASLRVAVFVIAVWVAWLAASSLAGAT